MDWFLIIIHFIYRRLKLIVKNIIIKIDKEIVGNIIIGYQYTNCTNCTNSTNINDFIKVTILNLWFLFIMYDFSLFLFLYKLHPNNDILNSFFVYFNAFHR